jgi:creatinine amidohydrolase
MALLDYRSTAASIRAARPTVAVISIGAVEQHSYHLPLGTDWLIARELSSRVAQRLDAFLVPPLPFSMSQCHGFMAGTVWLKPKTLAAVLTDVVSSLQAQGIHRIVLLNCHGGNFVLEAAMRELNLSRRDLRLIMPAGDAVMGTRQSIFQTAGQEVHAGEWETSVELAFNAEHVKAECQDWVPPVGREFLDYAFMDALSETGVWGCPTLATVEKGKAALDAQVEGICQAAQTAFAFLDGLRPSGSQNGGDGGTAESDHVV